MKIKSETLLIGLSSLVLLTFVTASDYTGIETNHILRINGPIFLRTSEEFVPDKMQYLAADINGNAYNIEGNSVNITFTGIENFHGKFLTQFPEHSILLPFHQPTIEPSIIMNRFDSQITNARWLTTVS